MPRSRPTTPVRRVSRGSISSHHRASLSASHGPATGSTLEGKGLGHSNSTQSGIVFSTASTSTTPTPLAFLNQAMADLADETSTLHANLEAVDGIENALHTFDESFAMLLYGLKMNAFCVEWPEAPGQENFVRAEERRAKTMGGGEAWRSGRRLSTATVGQTDEASSTLYDATLTAPADQTYMTQDDEDVALLNRRPTSTSTTVRGHAPLQRGSSSTTSTGSTGRAGIPLKSALKKSSTAATAPRSTRPVSSSTSLHAISQTSTAPAAKPKITAAERKKREAAAEQVIQSLPLEYRGGGGDPGAKQLAVRVILALIAAGQNGIRMQEIVRAPDLPQAKVNKCLIALVGAKQALRRSDNGVVYHLDPEKCPMAA